MKKFFLKFDPLESSPWLGLMWISVFLCLGFSLISLVLSVLIVLSRIG